MPPSIAEKTKEEEESDTDIGSHGDEDESFSFGEADVSIDNDDAAGSSGGGDETPSVSRMGAKVRRLNLCGDDSDGSMDVKKSLARSSQQGAARSSIGDNSPLNSPARKPHSGMMGRVVSNQSSMPVAFESPPASPVRVILMSPPAESPPASPSNNSPRCPPSTARKGRGLSRLFADSPQNDDSLNFSKSEEEEEDVSPRDVADFPFFGESPNSDLKNSGKENYKSCNGSKLTDVLSNLNSPECPPSTFKKPHRRMMELNNTSNMNSSPPKGLRTLERANSFLQLMFSQEMVVEGLKGIDEEDNNENDDFIHKPLPRHGSDDDSMGEFELSIPSPKRPMRSHHRRFTPSSPTNNTNENNNNNTNNTNNNTSFSRFVSDFEIVGTLGNGSFGCVYKVRNRMDRRLYAIKAAKREARGESDRNRMLQEVYALAALSDQACEGEMHIVRYHQAWMEGNRLYIQTELCESTLLEEMRIDSCVMKGTVVSGVSVGVVMNSGGGVLMGEKRRYKLLREMLLALDLVHKSGMIHLDIKPENIFIKNDQYKLGDFGLVSKIENHDDVEEGDSRYMSMELLSGDLDDLTKSDIFSLGATMYEICLGRGPQTLPENGPEWQDMRNGTLLPMPNTAFDMSMIIREMMAPDRHGRPSAEDMLKKRQLLSDEQRQLIVERNKANAANMALDVQMQRFKLLSPKNGNGRQLHRSNTIC